MSLGTKSGFVLNAVTTTGRGSLRMPQVPATTLLFITISGGTATVKLEISDDEVLFIPVASITQNSVVQFAIPASVLAANVTAVSGATVTVTYRTVLLANMPSETLLIYGTDGTISSPVELPTQTITDAFPLVRKKLVQQQANTTGGTIYTVPASTEVEVTHIRCVNVDVSNAATIKLWHDGANDATVILPAVSIPAGGWAEFDGKLMMEAADILGAQANTNSDITVTVYGYTKATA